ncbi:MAG: flagellar hook-associated protein FlgK [Oscillospiraceae bacterium]|nr:flagellar hook-associated protein FlgK [Oscillospiraceae bacterium]
MPIRPTFFGFEMAKTALSASQRNIDVTGQNIANINTEGYSRQRVNLSAVGAGGIEWKYPISPADNVGLGVNIDSIKRVRDEFLDIRYRTEFGTNGRFAQINETLTQVENLLDEFVMDNLHSSLTDFMNALQNFHMNSDEIEFASLMRSAALKLTTTLNKIANDIDNIVEMQLMQMDLMTKNMNNITKQLDDVNREIRAQYMFNPLSVSNELLDKRDMLLDQLSMYGEVSVVHDNSGPEGAPTGGIWVFFGETDVTVMDPTDPDAMMSEPGFLVRGDRLGHSEITFDTVEAREDFEAGDPVRFYWGENSSTEGDPIITHTGQIFGYYEMLNGIGDVEASGDELDFATKGVPFFKNIIDSFTFMISEVFNELNEYDDLFVSNDGDPINAFNITISQEWQDDAMYIIRTIDGGDTPGASRNDNILRMIDALRREDTDFGNFTGSFQQYIGMLNTEIAIEIDYNNKRLLMSDILLLSIDSMRESIKGVSEDEEAMNLARYQKSYNAAARYMTVLDEMLEQIVMRMGIAGR